MPHLDATADLNCIARELRARVIRMSHDGRAPHLGSSLSCIDILVAAYWRCLKIDPAAPLDPNRDRFILSKGHAAAALYATLAKRNFFDASELNNYNVAGSRFPEQPSPRAVPGIEAATGSLGHGLPIGLGMALAARIQQRDYRVVAVMSDGECNEGTVWEAAMFAAAQRLDNVTVIIDFNRWQATDRSEEVMALSPLVDKWRAFGWSAVEVDGHDIEALADCMNHAPLEAGKPTAIIARTVKGKGVSFMEDDNNWHYRVPNDEELQAALDELGVAENA
jgi:transketolase